MNRKILALYDILLNIQIDNLQLKLHKDSKKKKELKKLVTKSIK